MKGPGLWETTKDGWCDRKGDDFEAIGRLSQEVLQLEGGI
jgi:hypothetical protein